MRKYFLLLGFIVLGFVSCKKEATFDASKQAAIDDASIQAYMKANNITATKDASGLYYQIITPGTGAYPTLTSHITVNYSGSLLNKTVFDSGSINNALLTSFVKGWQIGVPHINTGGRILLLIPSGLGYENSPNGSIPANSVLIFTIDLTGFQ